MKKQAAINASCTAFPYSSAAACKDHALPSSQDHLFSAVTIYLQALAFSLAVSRGGQTTLKSFIDLMLSGAMLQISSTDNTASSYGSPAIHLPFSARKAYVFPMHNIYLFHTYNIKEEIITITFKVVLKVCS